MKSVLVIEAQVELQNVVFTNVKALCSFLITQFGVEPNDDFELSLMDDKYKQTKLVFNYANLVKSVKFNRNLNRMVVAQINDDITISEVTIKTQW